MKKESQDKKVLDWLMSGKGLSSMKAISMWKHTRLSRSINTLREDHEIFGKMVEHADSRFKLYYMRNSNLFNIYGESY